MTTAVEDNVRIVAVDGDFDDCQAILKSLFADQAFARAVDLSAVNSINFARIAAQSVYYFTAAAALGAPGRSVAFVVPTGNFGDAYAGWVARRMGLPIERIIVATNANDIMASALETGRYDRAEAKSTQSPAMDIQVASNFERLYFECVGRDGAETARAFEGFARDGDLQIPAQALSAVREVFRGVAVSETETSRAILAALNDSGHLVDPHTAVGLAGAAPGRVAAERRAAGHPRHRPSGQVPRGGAGGVGRLAGAAAHPPRSRRTARALRSPARRGRGREGLCASLRRRMSGPVVNQPKVHRLANGVTVICDAAPELPDLALSVVAGRGARFEDEARSGWSHLLEHMVFKGAGDALGPRYRRGHRGRGRPDQRRHRPRAHQLPGARRSPAACRWPWRSSPIWSSGRPSMRTISPGKRASSRRRSPRPPTPPTTRCSSWPRPRPSPISRSAARSSAPPPPSPRPTPAALEAWRAGLYAPDRLVISAAGAVDEDELLALAERHVRRRAERGHRRSRPGPLHRRRGERAAQAGAGPSGLPAAGARRGRPGLLGAAPLRRDPRRGHVVPPVPGGPRASGPGLRHRRL